MTDPATFSAVAERGMTVGSRLRSYLDAIVKEAEETIRRVEAEESPITAARRGIATIEGWCVTARATLSTVYEKIPEEKRVR